MVLPVHLCCRVQPLPPCSPLQLIKWRGKVRSHRALPYPCHSPRDGMVECKLPWYQFLWGIYPSVLIIYEPHTPYVSALNVRASRHLKFMCARLGHSHWLCEKYGSCLWLESLVWWHGHVMSVLYKTINFSSPEIGCMCGEVEVKSGGNMQPSTSPYSATWVMFEAAMQTVGSRCFILHLDSKGRT